MRLDPVINNNFANITFGIANSIKGTRPQRINACRINLLKQPLITDYNVGTLMAKATDYDTTGNLQIFDHTIASTNPFAGVFFDEAFSSSSFASTIVTNVTDGTFEIAQGPAPDTEFYYAALTGFNAGTADIDALITAGIASKVVIVEGSVAVPWVIFNEMVVGV
jgi:hypothetical protein